MEISDEMYVITKETAEAYKKLKEEPPRLTSLIVSPEEVRIEPGKKQAFVVKGLDQYGHETATGEVAWKATGGTIDKDGVFLAGEDEGNFVITAIAGAASGSATLTIAKAGAPLPPRPAPLPPGVLRWTGEIPPQKWMNFYTKVLAKFASGKGLKLTLSVEVAVDGGISPQKVEETKAALQELGLNADIQIS